MAKKSLLQRQLEESIRLAKKNRGKFPKRDALGRRLKDSDNINAPDSLADPEDHPPEEE